MDDDSLARGEAAAGLALLGLLMLALAGVFAYRVAGTPQALPRHVEAEAFIAEDDVAPGDAGDFGEIGGIEPAQAQSPLPPAVEPMSDEQPHFVAPSGRAPQP